MFLGLLKNGYVFPQVQLGAISPSTGRTLPDRYIEGTCPICGYPHARGDQCDNCGNQLDPSDLIEPRSRINGETPLFVETEQYFLDLRAFADVLGDWLQKQTHWRPNVRRFTLEPARRPQAARDHARSRLGRAGTARRLARPSGQEALRLVRRGDRLPVGVHRVGGADRRPGRLATVLAVSGRAGLLLHGQGQHRLPRRDLAGDAVRLLRTGRPRWYTRVLGALEVPYEVVSSEFLTMEGRKFSSSRNVVIYVGDMLSRYDPDALRYYLAVAGPENQDTDFTWAEFLRRNNDELVAGWGNLVNRTIAMTAKNLGAIPAAGALTDADHALLATTRAAFDTVGDLLARSRQKAAIIEVMRVVGEANKYLSDTEPWKLRTEDPDRMATRAARRAAGGRRLQDAADPVPAVVVLPGSRATWRNGYLGRDA